MRFFGVNNRECVGIPVSGEYMKSLDTHVTQKKILLSYHIMTSTPRLHFTDVCLNGRVITVGDSAYCTIIYGNDR